MKKILLALALVSATSLFADMAQWFNATPVQDTEVVLWSLNGEDGSVITNLTDTAYWEIDADVSKAGTEDATVFTPPALGEGLRENTITRVDISTTFDAMYDMTTDGHEIFVGEDQPLPPPQGSLGALVIGSTTNAPEGVVVSSNFYAWVWTDVDPGDETKKIGTWFPLYGADIPQSLTGDVVNVRIELLYLYGFKKLRYSIGTVDGNVTNYVALANSAGETLFPFETSGQNITGVEFSGCGKVHQVAAAIRDTEKLDGVEGDGGDAIYYVKTADSFYELQQRGNGFASNGKVKLFNDFTLDSWTAIGKPNAAIQYNFDGADHTITVKNLNGSFFGELDGCTVENLTIDATNATDNADAAAIFATACGDNVTFRNCTAAGHLYNETGMLAGFALYANDSQNTSGTSVTFEDCAVTATLDAANPYAFVAQISYGNVAAVADTTLATLNGYESYGTIVSGQGGTVPVAFNFCTNGVGDAADYSFYVEPALSDDPANCSYIVKKPSADDFEFDSAGYLKFVRPDNDQEHPVAYTGRITAGDDFVVDYYAPNTPYYKEYTIGNCVATWVSSDEQTTIKYASVAKALNDTNREAGGTVALYTANSEVTEWVLEADATVASGVTFDLCKKELSVAAGKTLTVLGGKIISYANCLGDIVLGENSTNVIRAVEGGETTLVQIGEYPFIDMGDGTATYGESANPLATLAPGNSIVITKAGESATRFQVVANTTAYIHWGSNDFDSGDEFVIAGDGCVYFDHETATPNVVLNTFAYVPEMTVEGEGEEESVAYYTLSYTTDESDAPCYMGMPGYALPFQVASGKKFIHLSDAIFAAGEGGTITLLCDYDPAGDEIEQAVTLALGTYKFGPEEEGEDPFTINTNVTITCSSIDNVSGQIIVGPGAVLTMSGLDPANLPTGLTITGEEDDDTAKLNNGTTTYTWNNGAWQPDEPQDDNVCQILVEGGDPVKYETLSNAIAQATSGQTIQLIANIDYVQNAGDAEEINVINGKKIINLDLNGKTITAKWASDFVRSRDTFTVIYIEGGSSLTIDDTTVGKAGTIRITECPDWCWSAGVSPVFNHGGILTINAGTYENISTASMSYAFDAYAGTTTINGGTYHAPHYTAFRQSANGVMTINGGTFTGKRAVYPAGGGDAKITINDGDFKAWEQVFHIEGSNNDRIDFTININGGTFALDAEDALIRLSGQSAGTLGGIFNNSSDYFVGKTYINVQDGAFTQSTGALVVDTHDQITLEVYGGTFDTAKTTLEAYVNEDFYDITDNTTRTVAAKPAKDDGVFDVNGSHGDGDRNHGLIKITDAQLKSLPDCSEYALADLTADQKDVAIEKLNGNGVNGLPRWQSIVLGIPATSDFAAKPTVKATQDAVTDSITFKLGVNPDLNSGAKIRYCLSDGTGVVKEFNDETGISIPVSGLFKGGAKAERITVKIIIDQVNEQPVPANN